MWLDTIIALVLVAAALHGWFKGFFKELASTIGFTGGIALVCYVLYKMGGDSLDAAFAQHSTLTLVAFCIFLPIALGLAAEFLTTLFEKMSLGIINHMMGMALGCAKYVLLISVLLKLFTRCHLISPDTMQMSNLSTPIMNVGHIMWQFISNTKLFS